MILAICSIEFSSWPCVATGFRDLINYLVVTKIKREILEKTQVNVNSPLERLHTRQVCAAAQWRYHSQ